MNKSWKHKHCAFATFGFLEYCLNITELISGPHEQQNSDCWYRTGSTLILPRNYLAETPSGGFQTPSAHSTSFTPALTLQLEGYYTSKNFEVLNQGNLKFLRSSCGEYPPWPIGWNGCSACSTIVEIDLNFQNGFWT
jgi:hypothetical protein